MTRHAQAGGDWGGEAVTEKWTDDLSDKGVKVITTTVVRKQGTGTQSKFKRHWQWLVVYELLGVTLSRSVVGEISNS